MNLLAKEWAVCRERLIPADASEDQVHLAHGTFYLGATAMFALLIWGGRDQKQPITEEEMRQIHAELERELREFHHLPPP